MTTPAPPSARTLSAPRRLAAAMAAITLLFAATLVVSLTSVERRGAAMEEARRLRAEGKLELAAQRYKEVIAKAPDLPTPHLELAGVLFTLDAAGARPAEGSYLGESIDQYVASIRLDPMNLAARHGLVRIYLELADRRERQAREHRAADRPEEAAERADRARLAVETARDLLLEAGSIDSDDSLTRLLLAEVYARLGSHAQASRLLAGLAYDPIYGERARERQVVLAAEFFAAP
jgi:tetratricopeptide (TPR) repeat protein